MANKILPQPDFNTIAAAGRPLSARSADYVYRLWHGANWAFHGDTVDNFYVDFGQTSAPENQNIYTATPATKRYRLAQRPNWGGVVDPQILNGTLTIPVPTGARAPQGRDGQVTIIELDTGGNIICIWNLWGPSFSWDTYPEWVGFLQQNVYWSASADNALGIRPHNAGYATSGFSYWSWIVAATVERYIPSRDHNNNLNTIAPVCPMHVGIIQPEEVIAGAINHGLLLAASGRCSMSGPYSTTVTDVDDVHVGVTVGVAAPPSPHLESRNTKSTTAQMVYMVPDGMPFICTASDADIEATLTRNNATTAEKAVLRPIAKCLTVYPWFIGATTGPNGPAFFGADASPTSKTTWRSLGVTSQTGNKLKGLFTLTNLHALRPPHIVKSVGGAHVFRDAVGTVVYP